MKARYLKSATLETLRKDILSNLSLYRNGSFDYLYMDQSLFFEGDFDFSHEEFSSLIIRDDQDFYDWENCLKVHNILERLTPYDARDERFWAYLTHTYMIEYTKKRWPIPEDDLEAVKHIKKHFFAKEKRDVERDNAASRLWWMAQLCHRVPGVSLEDALRVLLYRTDVRASIIERPTASQSITVFSAIIKVLLKSYQQERRLFDRKYFRQFMRHINTIGGVRLLDCMPDTQIASIIEEVVMNKIKINKL